MQDTVKRSLVAATILGILFPSISLLYVRREGLAVVIMALFVLSVSALNYTDLAFFPTSFWIFILVIIFLWIISVALGVWYAWRGISLEKMRHDKGRSWVMHVLLMLTFIGMLSNLPISFFQVKEHFANLYASDLLVVQKMNSHEYFQVNDTITFLDDNYQENIAQVLATAKDVLSSEEGKIYRNDVLTNIEITLPTDKSTTLQNTNPLASHFTGNMSKTIDINSMNTAANSWLIPDNMLLVRYPNTSIALLPYERVQGKAIYILFSKELSQNGKSLSSVVLP